LTAPYVYIVETLNFARIVYVYNNSYIVVDMLNKYTGNVRRRFQMKKAPKVKAPLRFRWR